MHHFHTKFICSVCNKIRNTKREIKDIRESARREIKYLQLQIQKVRSNKQSRIANLNQAIGEWNLRPVLFFEREIEDRKKFEEEHKNNFGGV